jgi:hypothetical protein
MGLPSPWCCWPDICFRSDLGQRLEYSIDIGQRTLEYCPIFWRYKERGDPRVLRDGAADYSQYSITNTRLPVARKDVDASV